MIRKWASNIRRVNFAVILFFCGLIFINILSINNSLLFHFLAEFTTIVISISLFAVLWMVREKIDNSYYSLIGIGILFISFIDLLHVLTFSGMDIFPTPQMEYSLYFYTTARLLQSLTFLIAPVCIKGNIKTNLAGIIFSVITAGTITAIFLNMLPPFINPAGKYTIYKTISDLAVIFFFLLSLVHISLRRSNFDKEVFRYIFLSVFFSLVSYIVIFTNTNETQLISVIGLDLKIISYFLLFQTVLVTGIEKPQDVFYYGLKTNWEQLQNLIENLNEGISIIDPKNNFIFSNPAANQIFGEKSYGINNKNILDFLSESQRQLYLNKLLDAGENDIPPYELEILRSDNEKRAIIITESAHIVENTLAGYFVIFHDITERKKELEKIEEAGRLYQTLFMDAPIRIWEVDNSQAKREIEKLRNKGVDDFERYFNEHHEVVKELAQTFQTITYNKLVEKYFSDENSQIIPLDQFFCEESYPAFIQELLAIAENKTRATYELTSRTNTGEFRHSLVNWSVLPGYEHDYSRVIISAEDITDRKIAEDELKASEEKFRQLAENSGVGIAHLDSTNRLIFLNKKAMEEIGVQENSYHGSELENIFGGEWGNKIKNRIADIRSSNKNIICEDRILIHQKEKWFYSNYTPIFNQQNEYNGVQIIFNDITEQKNLENQLESLARFPQENPHPVMRLSRTGGVVYSNKGGEKILHVWDYDNKSQVPEKIDKIVSKCLKSRKPEIVEVPVNRKIFSLYFTPIPDMGYVNIYGQDITNLKEVEEKLVDYSKGLEKIVAEKTEELIQAQERLLRQEKLATMGQLASSVGHELRNPLAVINNSLYMLRLNDSKQDKISKEYMNIIDQEVSNANKIITDLLTFARIKPVDLNPTDIHDLIEEIFRKFPPPEDVKVKVKTSRGLPLSLVDSTQIKQVVANLVTNAYQAIPVKGELVVDSRIAGQQIQIDFIDNGVGIPPENIDKIFEPLFTTKAKGIGLGLTVSKMLAEINNGKISVKSKVGKGSVFSLFLPIFEEEM